MGKGSSDRYSAPSRGESRQFVPQSASAYQAFPNPQREQTYNFKSDVNTGLAAIFNSFQQPSAQQQPNQLGPSGGLTMDLVPQQQPQYLPNPYSQPVDNYLSLYSPVNRRYAPPPRMVPQQFVPQSARNYVSPFGVQKEQTYYDLTRGTKPPPAPVKTVTAPAESVAAPAFDYGYSDYVAGDAAGGVVKAAAGRYLQGPGDGTSDSIPATIGNVQPARLADGEFVIDARTVSEIGNGSSNAGARKLYAMMERVHRERKKAKRGQNSNADRFLPR